MSNFGFLLAFSVAFAKAIKNITTKIATTETDEYVTGWSFRALSALLLIPAAIIFNNTKLTFELIFWGPLVINACAVAAITIIRTRAFRLTDVSIVSPLFALTPIAVAIPAWFLLNQLPSTVGLTGLLLVVVGTYLLYFDNSDTNLLEPLHRLRSDRGVQYAALSILIVAAIPSFDTIGIRASSPLLWTASKSSVTAVILLPILGYVRTDVSKAATEIRESLSTLLLIGISTSAIALIQAYAYLFIDVTYVQAIKQVSIVISVLYGVTWLDEPNTRYRLIGSILIFLGVAAIILA